MTEQEKQILLKDLCARLPYGVNILVDLEREFDGRTYGVLCRIEPYVGEKYPELKGQFLLYQQGCLTPLVVEEVRPYLRPISSMTEEEENELMPLFDCLVFDSFDRSYIPDEKLTYRAFDWLNAHHFDYRGLIPMGLALEAPEEMYNIKTE